MCLNIRIFGVVKKRIFVPTETRTLDICFLWHTLYVYNQFFEGGIMQVQLRSIGSAALLITMKNQSISYLK
jgi:hypothetical protein